MTFATFLLATALSMTGVLPIGKPAPESHTKMKNAVDGKSLSIADVTGKTGTLVIFTCDHCPFARGWEGRIVELGNAYVKKGVGVILINANDPSEHEEDASRLVDADPHLGRSVRSARRRSRRRESKRGARYG